MKRIVDKAGFRRDLEGGGWFRLLPSHDNLFFNEKLRRLAEERRVEFDLSVDAQLVEALGMSEYIRLLARAMAGTVVLEFGDFVRPDGSDIPCWRADGSLDEEAAAEIMLFPGVDGPLGDALKTLNTRVVQDHEIAEGNSSEPSVGNSATEVS